MSTKKELENALIKLAEKTGDLEGRIMILEMKARENEYLRSYTR